MNDSIDTVRKFWRDSILESGTRGGLCVKKALENNAVRQINVHIYVHTELIHTLEQLAS